LLVVAIFLVECGKSVVEVVVYAGGGAFRRTTKTPAVSALIVRARNGRRLIVGHDRALVTSHENGESPEADTACTASARKSPRFVTIPAFEGIAEQENARDSDMKPVEIRRATEEP
jgi:hypothetical protein